MIFSLEIDLFALIIKKIKNRQSEEMKKRILIAVGAYLLGGTAFATDYLQDIKNLGYVSGEGLACGASRYPSYEFIARAYMITSARSDKEQADGMYEYNSAKATAYLNKKRSGNYDCPEVNSRFNNQKIFQTVVYKNGTLKMPDGKVIKPRRDYDVTLVYNRDENESAKLDEYYKRIMARKRKSATRQGIFQKIRQEEAKAQNQY